MAKDDDLGGIDTAEDDLSVRLEREYRQQLPIILAGIADEEKRRQIERIVYEKYRPDYNAYGLNQNQSIEDIVNDDGEQKEFPDKREECQRERYVIQRTILDCLSRLPLLEQRVIRLLFYEGWPYRKIAESIGISKSEVGNILKRACKELKSDLSLPIDILNCFEKEDSAVYPYNCGKLGISEYFSNECPCKLPNYLKGSFNDGKTVCPGSYTDDGRRLLCPKRVTVFIGEVPQKNLSIKEAAETINITRHKVEQYRDTGRLPTTPGPRRIKKICGEKIKDCGQEVYHYKEKENDEKYRLNLNKYLEYCRYRKREKNWLNEKVDDEKQEHEIDNNNI